MTKKLQITDSDNEVTQDLVQVLDSKRSGLNYNTDKCVHDNRFT